MPRLDPPSSDRARSSGFVFSYRGALIPLALLPALAISWPSSILITGISALCLLAVGVSLRLTGIRRIGGRARVHKAGARTLLTQGAFAHTRNPLYLANIAVACAAVAIFHTLYAVPLVVISLLILYTLVVKHEEGELENTFGDEYRRYAGAVPRWMVRTSAFKTDDSGEIHPWSLVLHRERGFVAGTALLAIAAILPMIPALGLQWTALRTPAGRFITAGVISIVSAVLVIRIMRHLRRKRLKEALGASVV